MSSFAVTRNGPAAAGVGFLREAGAPCTSRGPGPMDPQLSRGPGPAYLPNCLPICPGCHNLERRRCGQRWLTACGCQTCASRGPGPCSATSPDEGRGLRPDPGPPMPKQPNGTPVN
jgi:hypothetical protein